MLDAAPHSRLDDLEPDSPKQAGCIRHRAAVLATYSQAETWAETNLRQRGYDPFVPRYTARRRDRVTPSLWHFVRRPLFPGYIFVPYSPPDLWRPIRYCPGIRANLLGGNGIQYVSAAVLGMLQAGEAVRATTPPEHSLIVTGEAVVVSKGAANGMVGAVISIHGDSALIGLMMFGHLREVWIPIASLERRDGCQA
jgi:transcription antitermination factor NusG